MQENSDSLKQAYDYYVTGRIYEMNQSLHQLTEDSFTTVKDKLTYKVLKCYELLYEANYDKCLREATSLLISCENERDYINLINITIILAEIYEWTGKYTEGIEIIEKGEQTLNNLQNNDLTEKLQKKFWFTHFRGRNSWNHGEYDKAQSYFEEALNISKKTKIEHDYALALQNIGLIRYEKSDTEGAFKYHEEARQIFKKLGNNFRLGWCLHNLSVFESQRGDKDKAIAYSKESLKFAEESGNIVQISWTLLSLGLYYADIGELSLALECLQRSLVIGKIGNKPLLIMANLSLADVYRRKGDLEAINNYLNKAKDLIDESIDKKYLIFIEFDYALVYWMRGEIKQSLEILEALFPKIKENRVYISDTQFSSMYFWTIFFALDIEDLNKAIKYQALHNELLHKVTDKFVILEIQQRDDLISALLLKMSSRIRDKAKAEEIFEKIIETKSNYSLFREISMINLCELLIDELKIYGDKDVLEEINELVTKLYSLSQEQGSFTLMTNTLIIQAKLALIEGNVSKSEKFLEEAKKTTEEKGLNLLEEKVKTEKKYLDSQYQNWKKMIEENVSFGERIEQVKFNDYLKEAKKYVNITDLER